MCVGTPVPLPEKKTVENYYGNSLIPICITSWKSFRSVPAGSAGYAIPADGQPPCTAQAAVKGSITSSRISGNSRGLSWDYGKTDSLNSAPFAETKISWKTRNTVRFAEI